MSAPRPRRRRIRNLIIILSQQALVALDNEQDGTIWESSLPIFARCLPLDEIADANLTAAQMDVATFLESCETCLESSPTAAEVEAIVVDLEDLVRTAGL